MEKEKLSIILEAHSKWLSRDCDGEMADLRGADLRGAKLRGADLSGANLRGAKLRGAKYNSCTAFYALQCPEAGEFTGYKSAGSYIVELKIPAAAKRSSATSRKCRCSEAQIMSITNPDGTPAEVSEVASNRDNHFVYHVGETVKVDDFCEDRWVECAAGIHFFITRDEAVNYVNRSGRGSSVRGRRERKR